MRIALRNVSRVCIAAVLASGLVVGLANAGTVEILAGTEPGTIRLEVRDATTAEILIKLGARYNFTVDKLSDAAGNASCSGRWTGSLDEILRRVLKSESHVIAGGGSNGLSKITLLDSKPSAAPAAPSAVATAAPHAGKDTARAPEPMAQSVPTPTAPAPSKSAPIAPASGSVGQSPVTPISPVQAANAEHNGGIVADHMQQMMQPFAPSYGGSGAGSAPSPVTDMVGLTQQAHANVQNLAASLRGICIGDNCGGRSK